jgi:Mn-dependent DtxR family transcriptional regulator
MKTRESVETYLETILTLQSRIGAVRSIDIATELGYSRPSVSVAIGKLREQSMIQVDAGGYITLLAKGKEIAERITERHESLTLWLVNLGVPREIAEEDACRIEHVISEESFLAMKNHARMMYRDYRKKKKECSVQTSSAQEAE